MAAQSPTHDEILAGKLPHPIHDEVAAGRMRQDIQLLLRTYPRTERVGATDVFTPDVPAA